MDSSIFVLVFYDFLSFYFFYVFFYSIINIYLQKQNSDKRRNGFWKHIFIHNFSVEKKYLVYLSVVGWWWGGMF